MTKWVGICICVPILVLVTIAYSYGLTLRKVAIIQGKSTLKQAAKEYAEHGYVTNYGSTSYQVWLSTNVVSIRGTKYEIYITTTNDRFLGEGVLGITTNQVFIWLDNNRPAKIIDTNYTPPIFPPRF